MNHSQSSIPLTHEQVFWSSDKPDSTGANASSTDNTQNPQDSRATLVGIPTREGDRYDRIPTTLDYSVKFLDRDGSKIGEEDVGEMVVEQKDRRGWIKFEREESPSKTNARGFEFPERDEEISLTRLRYSLSGAPAENLRPSHSKSHSRSPSYQGSFRSLWNIAPSVLITALVCTIGVLLIAGLHHGFNGFLDGKNVNESVDPSLSSKIGTGLSVFAKMVTGFGMSVMIEQMVWYYVRRQRFSVETLDRLFQFPSSVSLLRQANLLAIAPLASLATLIVAVTPFSTVVAPTALTIVPARWKSGELTVPTIDLSAYDNLALTNAQNSHYNGPKVAARRTAFQRALSQDAASWTAPAQCGSACNYTIDYFAPALKCEDKQLGGMKDTQTWLLDISSHDVAVADPHSDDPNAISHLYTFTAGYRYCPIHDDGMMVQPGKLANSFQPGTMEYGSYCTAYNASYRADISFLNSSQITNLSVSRYFQPLNVSLKNEAFRDPVSNPEFEEDLVAGDVDYQPYSVASSFALLDSFGFVIVGLLTADSEAGNFKCIDQTTHAPETGLFRMNDTTPCGVFLPAAPNPGNVSLHLQGLFANVTTGFLDVASVVKNTDPDSLKRLKQPMAKVQGKYLPNYNIYSYDSKVLLPTYGALFSLHLVVCVAGLYCLKKSGVAGSFELSMLLSKARDFRFEHPPTEK